MSLAVAESERSPAALPNGSADGEASAPRASLRGEGLILAGVAVLVAAIAFIADGGLELGSATLAEVVLLLVGGAVVAAAILRAPASPLRSGGAVLVLLAALAALTALSILWAVQPADAWNEANRTLAYLAAFAGAFALARIAPGHERGIAGGIAAGCLVVCGYALASKVFPSQLAHGALYARLREPFGYWNAVGLTAALALMPLAWLAARRDGPRSLRAGAVAGISIALVALMLSYSRGALIAAVVGLAAWFWIVALRLRSASALAIAAACAAPVVIWAFSNDDLSADRIALADRTHAGHLLGLAIVVMAAAAFNLALAAWAWRDRHPLAGESRRRAGIAVVAALALLPAAGVVTLAATGDGLTGNVSTAWHDLTDTRAGVSNGPERLTAASSTRARYWSEAWKVWRDHPVAGAGADGFATARLRYRADRLEALHAHGYLVQTLADLGLIGLALSLALLAAWIAAARGALITSGAARRPALGALVATVVTFGTHSLLDWTWFVPATALVALIAAGYLAGLVPAQRSAAPAATGGRRRIALAAGVAVVVLAAAWSTASPWRAQRSENGAFTAVAAGDLTRAERLARQAHDRNPISIEALFTQAAVAEAAGRLDAARAAYERAVRLAPASPESWRRLADFQFSLAHEPAAAVASLAAALYLDPKSDATRNAYVNAQRAAAVAK